MGARTRLSGRRGNKGPSMRVQVIGRCCNGAFWKCANLILRQELDGSQKLCPRSGDAARVLAVFPLGKKYIVQRVRAVNVVNSAAPRNKV
jgi:hypothetical protein